MVGLKLHNDYQVPCRWAELDGKRFIKAAAALALFEQGKIDFNELRLRIVAAVLLLNLKKTKVSETLYENLFRISESLDFYEITEDDGRRTLDAKVVMSENMLPKVGDYRGYLFSIRDGVVDTDITAERYIDAISLLTHYSRTQSPEAIDKLVATLYSRAPYSAENVRKVKLREFSIEKKLAIYVNFRGILEWIQRLPKYDILFHTTSPTSDGPALIGPEGTMYQLSKAGFGSVEEIGRLPLFSYLDIQLAVTCSGIREMHGMKMKITEICDRTHLTAAQIATVLR